MLMNVSNQTAHARSSRTVASDSGNSAGSGLAYKSSGGLGAVPQRVAVVVGHQLQPLWFIGREASAAERHAQQRRPLSHWIRNRHRGGRLLQRRVRRDHRHAAPAP